VGGDTLSTDEGPTTDEAAELLDDHIEVLEDGAENLPTDVKDGDAGP
jgi:hypothetical protein